MKIRTEKAKGTPQQLQPLLLHTFFFLSFLFLLFRHWHYEIVRQNRCQCRCRCQLWFRCRYDEWSWFFANVSVLLLFLLLLLVLSRDRTVLASCEHQNSKLRRGRNGICCCCCCYYYSWYCCCSTCQLVFSHSKVEFSCQIWNQHCRHCCDSEVSSIALARNGNEDTAKQAKCTNRTNNFEQLPSASSESVS